MFVIEGATADHAGNSFGLFEVGVDIQAGITNVLPYKIWMTPLDNAHAISISSPTLSDTIVTNPALPGLKLDLPAQTVIYDHYGHVVQFTGRENDGTGLYFYRGRYYKPGYGRFISEDPIGFSAGDVNLYSYVGQDPVNNRDPFGHSKIYGNWCGPNWTGGQKYPYDPNKGPYKDPVSGSGGSIQRV